MATRKPLVRVAGKSQQLPAADTIDVPGARFTESETEPTVKDYGDRWLDETSGIKYTWISPGVWVDLATAGIDFDDLVQTTGNQSKAGVLTFTDSPVVPAGASGAEVPQAQEVVLRTQILGTVSESGGVPTGAVVETGSNANGRYIRWADGTQICEFTMGSSLTTSNATNQIFRSNASGSMTFAASFSATPLVIGTVSDTTTSAIWGGAAVGVSTTGFTEMRLHSSVSTATAHLSYVAIGRWF